MRLIALLLVSIAFAGCLTDDAAEGPGTDAPPEEPMPTEAPHLDAAATLADLKAFSEAYPYRQSGTPAHLDVRDAMADRFAAAGLEVVRQTFPSGDLPGPLAYDGENIIGIKWGSDRDNWIVVGSHYDITEGAVYGTYDDGSGNVLTLRLAEAFAQINTTRTILFVEFDQEELGLVGSRFFVQSVLDGDFVYDGTVDAMLDLDMIGITWPHPAHLVVWENSETLKQWLKDAAAAHTDMPLDRFDFRLPKGGSSDGKAFIDVGIPTAYLWSDWDEYIGPDGKPMPYVAAYVGAYPWWHKMDTYETMVAAAGDEATLTAGFQTVLDIVSPLLVRMANDVTPDVRP